MRKESVFFALVLIVFGFVFFTQPVFFTPPIYGAITSSCGLNNTNALIMLLSGNTDAHGQTYNASGSYSTQICFNQLFAGTSIPSNPHRCTTTNHLLNLSSVNDAHAENSTYGNYPIGVCYGNLVCSVKTACSAGQVAVVYLSAQTNAHLSKTGGAGTGYPYAVCCSSAGNTPNSGGDSISVQWQNGMGQQIGRSRNATTNVNKNVRMAAFTDLGAGKQIKFDVWEDDGVSDDFIRSFSVTTNNAGTAAVYNFIINSSDIARGDEIGEGEFLEFYFNASVINSSQSRMSEILEVDTNPGINTPPVVNITKVKHRGIYFSGIGIEFNQSSYDMDGDSLTYKWTVEEDNLVKTTRSFNYAPTNSGQKTITLRVTDSRGEWREQQIAISVIGSSGILAFISSPLHKQVIKDRTYTNNPLSFSYSANDSYVIRSVGTCLNLKCLAGNCPATSENKPASCTNNISVEGTPKDFSSLLFKWRFDDNSVQEGMNNYTGIKNYGEAGDKLITLILNYSSSAENLVLQKTVTREFTLVDLRQCVDDGRTWVEFDENDAETRRLSTLDTENGQCGGADGNIATGGDNCCPNGYECSPNGCKPQAQIQHCSDYLTQSACQGDNSSLRIALTEDSSCGRIVHGSVVRCWCEWEQGTSGNACKFKKSSVPGGQSGTTISDSGCTYSSCAIETLSTGQCNEGYKSIEVKATFLAGTCEGAVTQEECKSETRSIPCARKGVELGFFGVWQFMISLILIGAVYIVMFRKKDE